MFKFRDNTMHNAGELESSGNERNRRVQPFVNSPNGSPAAHHTKMGQHVNTSPGAQETAAPAPLSFSDLFADVASAGVANANTGRNGGQASRKRGRDIRGLEKFSSVVYSDSGFPRLNAMISRNPELMYPPEDTSTAREKLMMRQQQETTLGAPVKQPRTESGSTCRADLQNDQQDEFFDAFRSEEQRAEMERAASSANADDNGKDCRNASLKGDLGQSDGDFPPLSPEEVTAATYHHRQLDAYLRVLYEFNHLTFMKLPLQDTLVLLGRCGRAAMAHVIEYETRVRLQRERKLAEVQRVDRTASLLGACAADFESMQSNVELEKAVERQVLLDEAERNENGEEVHHTAVQAGVEIDDEAEWLAALKENFEREQDLLLQQQADHEHEP